VMTACGAPAGAPQAVITRLHTDMSRIMSTADMQRRMAELGAEAANETPEQFGAFIRAEIPKWAKVIRDSGATAD
jgi:tripartite-type tricarboxylate transporter receptor subunit TctC